MIDKLINRLYRCLGRIILKNNKKIRFKCFKGDIRDRSAVFDWVKKNDFTKILILQLSCQ